MISFDQPAWRYAVVFMIFFALIAGVWVVVKEPGIKERIRQRIIARRSPAAPLPRESSHAVAESQPVHQTSPALMPDHDHSGAPVITVPLFSSASMNTDTMPQVDLSKGANDIVRLELTQEEAGSYRAELRTIEGRSVFRTESLASVDSGAGPAFVVDVPMRLLKSGVYQVKLIGISDGSEKKPASYYFRVR